MSRPWHYETRESDGTSESGSSSASSPTSRYYAAKTDECDGSATTRGFERWNEALRASYNALYTEKRIMPNPLIEKLVDNREPCDAAEFALPPTSYAVAGQKCAGVCTYCRDSRVPRATMVRPSDCSRCVLHAECAAYMCARSKSPDPFCVTRAFGCTPGNGVPQCGVRRKRAREPVADPVPVREYGRGL